MRKRFAILFVMFCVSTMTCSTASATTAHPLISSFSAEAFPISIAVDNSSSASTNDVYVGTTNGFTETINRFTETGTYQCQITGAGELSTSLSECDKSGTGVPPDNAFDGLLFGGAAVNDDGDLYVGEVAKHVVDEFSPAGKYISQIVIPNEGEPGALAVDPDGNILIADPHNNVVYRYDVSTDTLEGFVREGPHGPVERPHGLAVNDDPASASYGDVYVTFLGSAGVSIYDSKGAYRSELTNVAGVPFIASGPMTSDPATGDLYVLVKEGIDEFATDGSFVSRIPLPAFSVSFGIAVDATSGKVYVPLLSEGVVDVFGPARIVPTVTTTPPSNVQPTAATLEGTVDPAGGGVVTSCQFEWGESTSYGNTAACSPSTPYSGVTQVDSGSISGLTPDTAYHFRLAATNANGTEHSEDRSFETTGVPTVTDEAVAEDGQTQATVQAKIDPHGFATTYQVEYGLCASTCPATYEASVPVTPATAGSGTTAATVSQEITGLLLDREYHYRFVATNSQGPTIDGEDQTFETSPAATVEYVTETAGPHEATIKAKVFPYGEETTCRMQYVSEADYQGSGFANATTLACSPTTLAARSGPHNVLVQVDRLAIDTVYRYRFVTANASGETVGLEGSVATFGISAFAVEMRNESGGTFTQAGGHPYDLLTNLVFAQTPDGNGEFTASGNVKDVQVDLPAGLVGNPSATLTCTRGESERKRCTGAAQVGTIVVHALEGEIEAPLFNIAPPAGVATELGARINNFTNAFIDVKVRTGGDYGLDAASLNITGLQAIRQVTITVWGVPASPGHDQERSCPQANADSYETPCAISERGPLEPFMTASGSCSGANPGATVRADAYQQPGVFVEGRTEMPRMEGCDKLRFDPTISVTPESSSADSPTGLEVKLHIPQEESPTGLAEADLKDATVTLPQGMTVNPSAANGLVGCSEAEIELHGPEPAKCPDASKIGSVDLQTPLFPQREFKGGIYIAQQGANPFGSLLAIYLAIDEPETGVVIKLAGHVVVNQITGQLTTTFSENPQLPFENLTLRFFGGQQAALATPPGCGTYTTTTSLTPWSGGAAAEPFSSFQITSGPGGSGCGAQGFAPALTAGSTNNQAGGYSPFVLALSRQDGEQRFRAAAVQLPPGLEGAPGKVPLCAEAQANVGSCPAASQIGHVTVSAGVGGEPVVLPQAGKPQDPVYLTGPYGGAPFGLSIVVPAEAGPFNLDENGHPVVVRAALKIDPKTAQVLTVSDPLPTRLQGIPLDVKTIVVTIDRPEFLVSPTNCAPLSVVGAVAGDQGAAMSVSNRFEAANCANLRFKPKFTVSTRSKTSKANGASLTVKVSEKPGEVNIHKVDLQLPKTLPSRLTTLQKACTAAQFEVNPAGCPVGSNIGTGIARTPLLNVPLTGPAYLVSHGGAAFPDVEFVLQANERGGNVEIVLDGHTDIKKGITFSRFETVPDAPISSFEAVLPEGPHSVLAASIPVKARGSLCGQNLKIPTTLAGQDGAVLTQTTKIAVTGCPKKKAKKAKKTSSTHHGKGKATKKK